MFSATFIFDKKQFDDELHALDALIAAAFQVIVSQVLRSYGDGRIPLPTRRAEGGCAE